MEFLAWVYQKIRNLRIFTFLMCFMGWVSWKIIFPSRKKKLKLQGLWFLIDFRSFLMRPSLFSSFAYAWACVSWLPDANFCLYA